MTTAAYARSQPTNLLLTSVVCEEHTHLQLKVKLEQLVCEEIYCLHPEDCRATMYQSVPEVIDYLLIS